MTITLSHQLSVFIWSCFLGICIGMAYISLRILRLAVKHNRWIVYIQDFIFMALCGVITFLFCIGFNNGEVRVYIIIGIFIGAVLFVNTLGKIVLTVMKFILKYIYKFCAILALPLVPLIEKVKKKCHNNTKKVSKNKKIYLQQRHCIVYNLFGRFFRSNKFIKRKKLNYEGDKSNKTQKA